MPANIGKRVDALVGADRDIRRGGGHRCAGHDTGGTKKTTTWKKRRAFLLHTAWNLTPARCKGQSQKNDGRALLEWNTNKETKHTN